MAAALAKKSAERAFDQLGRVNPLALEEFAALEERHQFLSEQLEDLRKTRKDLLDIVREVDLRVSVIPGVHGEDAVIRILDKQAMVAAHGRLTLDALGFGAPLVASLRERARRELEPGQRERSRRLVIRNSCRHISDPR